MDDGVSDMKREAEDMALARAAYRLAKEDLDSGRFAYDPRVVISRTRAKLTQNENKNGGKRPCDCETCQRQMRDGDGPRPPCLKVHPSSPKKEPKG